MAPGYVPAWRRLGLKLKSSSQSGNSDNQTHNPRHTSPEPASKRRKLDSSHLSNGISEPAPTPTKAQSAIAEPTRPRRKSVTFSPTAKTSDGSSTKRLVEQAEVSRLARASGVEAEDIDAAAKELDDIPWSANGTPKVGKRTKKQKHKATDGGEKKAERDSSTNTPESEDDDSEEAKTKTKEKRKAKRTEQNQGLLDYLDTYYRHREWWKFNKNTQTTLLKCVFNLWRIPPSYDEALRAYISGLQGSRIRDKLLAEADGIVGEDGEGADGEDKEGGGEEAENIERRKERVERAKLVWEAVGESRARFPEAKIGRKIEGEEDGEAEGKVEDGRKRGNAKEDARADPKMRKSRRKRMRKTGMEISSESSSESSQDSENEEEDGNRDKKTAVNGAARKKTWWDESSSSSSDEDSE